MKKFLLHILLLCFFFLILLFPALTLNGAVSGLLLWYSVLLPTLLPFIITTNLIIKTNSFTLISKIFGTPFEKIFGVSKEGSFAVIIGFLCGYPMGAKVISDLYIHNTISKNEAQYLLSFCNNTSPIFIISYLVTQILRDTSLLFPTFLCLYGAPVIFSFFTRNYYRFSPINNNIANNSPTRFSMPIIDRAIIDGISLIIKIGGYVMLFSIFISLLTPFAIEVFSPLAYLLPALEITNGIQIYKLTDSLFIRYCQLIFITSFGGLCAVAQTQCVLQDTDLNISHYLLHKVLTSILAIIMAGLYLYLF